MEKVVSSELYSFLFVLSVNGGWLGREGVAWWWDQTRAGMEARENVVLGFHFLHLIAWEGGTSFLDQSDQFQVKQYNLSFLPMLN